MLDPKVFIYHPPKGNQAERYEIIRNAALGFAEVLERQCPESSEKAVAINKIREAVMWANASIATRE